MRTDRSVLESLSILEPCSLAWGELTGDERRRFCGRCAKDVHNLSAMTAPEAEALVRASGGERLCVTYVRGPDGRPRTRPQAGEPVARPLRTLGWLLRALWRPMLGALALAPGCGRVTDGPLAGPQAPAPTDPPEVPPDELRMLGGLACGPGTTDAVMGEVVMPAPVPLPAGGGEGGGR